MKLLKEESGKNCKDLKEGRNIRYTFAIIDGIRIKFSFSIRGKERKKRRQDEK